jgi:hypothetical protein
MNLVQTVSKILDREVSEEEAKDFALNQYGVLTTFNKKWEMEVNYKGVADRLAAFLVSKIKPAEYTDGLKLIPFVHDPRNVEDYVAVSYIDDKGLICMYDPYASDETRVVELGDLYIDDLLKIIQIQENENK